MHTSLLAVTSPRSGHCICRHYNGTHTPLWQLQMCSIQFTCADSGIQAPVQQVKQGRGKCVLKWWLQSQKGVTHEKLDQKMEEVIKMVDDMTKMVVNVLATV